MIMFDKRTFLFECDQCEMIVSVEFDNQEEIEDVQENKTVLECPCGGHCIILWD